MAKPKLHNPNPAYAFAPSLLLTSALFDGSSRSITKRPQRTTFEDIPALGAPKFKCKGHYLGQFDRAVFMAVLSRFEVQHEGEDGCLMPKFEPMAGSTAEKPRFHNLNCEFELSELLCAMGYGIKGDVRAKARLALNRLFETYIQLETGEMIHLIKGYRPETATGTKAIEIEVDARFYHAYKHGSAKIDAEHTRQFEQQVLAGWLYGWIVASGKEVYARSITHLQEYSGNTSQTFTAFKRNLDSALDFLVTKHLIQGYRYDDVSTGKKVDKYLRITKSGQRSYSHAAARTVTGDRNDFRQLSTEQIQTIKKLCGGWLTSRPGDEPDDAELGRVRFTAECHEELKRLRNEAFERLALHKELANYGHAEAKSTLDLARLQLWTFGWELRVRSGNTKDRDWTANEVYTGSAPQLEQTEMEELVAGLRNRGPRKDSSEPTVKLGQGKPLEVDDDEELPF